MTQSSPNRPNSRKKLDPRILRLRKARDDTGMSQLEVGQILKKDQSAIARWERGEAEPRLSELLLLAKIYRCALGNLVVDGDGFTAEERALIAFLRANPVHRKILLSQLAVLKETVPPVAAE